VEEAKLLKLEEMILALAVQVRNIKSVVVGNL